MSVLFAIALTAWGVTVVSGVLMITQRKPGLSLMRLMVSGMAWFRADNFGPRGQVYRRYFLGGFFTFMAAVILIAVASILLA